jgi:NitT/TauT family transport system permease protein
VAFNSLPRIALVPLITMIFGFGVLATVVLAWTIVFFNTFQGARAVDADLIRSARFLGGESGGGLGYLIIQSLGTLNAADMMVALISPGVIAS